jgi:hypothetical protein
VRGIQHLIGWDASFGHLRPLCLCNGIGLHAQNDWATQYLDSGLVGLADNGVNCYIVDGNDRYAWFISSPSAATFTGSITTTTLTVTVMLSGTIAVGQALFGDGIAQNTVITALGNGDRRYRNLHHQRLANSRVNLNQRDSMHQQFLME